LFKKKYEFFLEQNQMSFVDKNANQSFVQQDIILKNIEENLKDQENIQEQIGSHKDDLMKMISHRKVISR